MTTDALRDEWRAELKKCKATIRALQSARKRASDEQVEAIGYKLARQNIRREVLGEALDLLGGNNPDFLRAEAQDRAMTLRVKGDLWEAIRARVAEAMEGDFWVCSLCQERVTTMIGDKCRWCAEGKEPPARTQEGLARQKAMEGEGG